MKMKFNQCEQFKQEYDHLKTLQQEFKLEYQKAVKTGKLEKAQSLKKEMEEKMASLEKKLWPFEHLSRKELKEQYESQKQILEKTGILEKLSSGEMGIKGIDNHEYAFPKIDEIIAKMKKNKEVLKTKAEQGFQKLLIVPFGMKLDDLIEKYGEVILKHHKEGKLFATKKKPSDSDESLGFDENQPVWRWYGFDGADTKGKLVYYPKEFSKNHQGKTKKQVLDQTKQGFNILLIEDLPNIPKEGEGETTKGRKQLETNKNPREYLKAIQTNPTYQNEQGMTPEDQIVYAITHLEQTNQVIDDYKGNGSTSWQLGGYFHASGDAPVARLDRGDRPGITLSGNNPGVCFFGYGVRTEVKF